MPFYYAAYGLQLASSVPLPRLTESRSSFPADVQIFLHESPSWLSESLRKDEEIFYLTSNRNEAGSPSATFLKSPTGSYCRILYGDGTEFILDRQGTKVWGIWTGNLTLEDAVVYLLGPVMGFVLRLRGIVSLHASAIAMGGCAITLIGPPGAGKSSTAACFAKLGYRVLSDDVVPVLDRGDSFCVQSGYPCVCLWPDSVKSLYGSVDSLPLLSPTWDKRYLPLGDERHCFYSGALPLAAVYILDGRAAEPDRPFAEPVNPAEGLIAAVGNTYMNYLSEANARAREFEFLGRLARAVPVRRVKPHANPAFLEKLCEVIVEDLRGLKESQVTNRAVFRNQHA